MTDKKELLDTVIMAIHQQLANTHTILPAIVTKVDSKTINCRPVINRIVDGESIPLPEFTKVPPIFTYGGASYTAHPISVGDYCILLVMERCFDKWYAGQDFAAPIEYRLHDYSDCMAIVGPKNESGSIVIPSVITQMGDTYQEGDYEHLGDREQTGDYSITGGMTHVGNRDITGDDIVNGNSTITGTLTFGTVKTNGGAQTGVSGTFQSGDGKTITITNGIITSIV